jgi:hypothetical protein
MAIERDATIKFHEEGTLIAVTRWIGSHDEGLAEWLEERAPRLSARPS